NAMSETRTATTRRTMLQTAAAATTLLAMPFVRGAHAAGKLAVGFWDHWVPGGNEPLEKLCREWAEKEKVDIKIDFITSNGDKDLLTAAAEAQAKTGHDIMQLTAWYAPGYAESLEPVDDIMVQLIREHGAVNSGAEYLGKQDGHWVAVPTSYGSTLSPPCGRIDLLKQIAGLDITKMYPAGAPPDKELTDKWTWEFFTEAAQKCHKAGFPFGMPMSTTSDAVQWTGGLFNSYGAQLVGQLWTYPAPKGPKGRHISGRYRYWGIWNFSKNKAAAKSLLVHLSTRDAIGKMLQAGQGFDVPPFDSLNGATVWAEAEPLKGTLYNFPPRGDVIVSVAGYPAPARIGVQMYSQGI